MRLFGKFIKRKHRHPNRSVINFLVYEWNEYFLKKFIPYYKGVLVDLGCGEAPYKEFFLQYVEKYIGVDWSRSLHNIRAEVISDLNKKIDLPDEVADVVISISVMEHLCEPEVFLGESFRILKKGGVMILQIPFQWWIHEEPYDYFRYTPYGLRYLLGKVGFEGIEIYPVGGFFTMWLLKLNYFVSRNISWGNKLNRYMIRFKLDRVLHFIFVPFFVMNQVIATILDRLDRYKYLETAGYWVVCKKPNNISSEK